MRDGFVSAELYLDCKCPDGFDFLEQFHAGVPKQTIMNGSPNKFVQRFSCEEDNLQYYHSFRCQSARQNPTVCPYGHVCPYAEALKFKASEKLPIEKRRFVYNEALLDLNELIGMVSIKNEIRNWANYLTVQSERNRRNIQNDNQPSYHMTFEGSPGTGKTVTARILADIFFGLGISRTRKCVEVERADLVAGYVGQTAGKTKKKIKEALGGVLFIDEAYSLARGEYYGREAIDTIVKNMEDHREDLIVIFAGYTKEMEDFMKSNPGLKSRIAKVLLFPNFTMGELLQMAYAMAKERQYDIDLAAKAAIQFSLREAMEEAHFGNARTVRNVLDSAVQRHATRLIEMNNDIHTVPDDALKTLTHIDFSDFDFVDLGDGSRAAISTSAFNHLIASMPEGNVDESFEPMEEDDEENK